MSPNRLVPAEIPAGTPYVLLVEDEVEDEALAQRILKKYRIANHVLWVKDGEEALKLLEQRLGAAPQAEAAAGMAPGESAPAMHRLRSWESGAAGASLPPAPSPARPPGPPPGRPPDAGEAKGTNGLAHGPDPRAARPPEMVLLDFGQARVPSLEIVRRMRTLSGMANIPVALCCRTPEEERQVKESALPRVSVLSKPIGFFKLLECIQKMDMHWFVFSEKP